MRWAESVRDDNPKAPPDELQAIVRSVIGDGYMADHAMSHIGFIDGFELNPEADWRYVYNGSREEHTRRYAAESAAKKAELVAVVQDLWLTGRNTEIRKMSAACISIHEVETWRFVPDIHTTFVNVGWGKNIQTVERPRYRNGGYWIGIVESYDQISDRVNEWFVVHPHTYNVWDGWLNR